MYLPDYLDLKLELHSGTALHCYDLANVMIQDLSMTFVHFYLSFMMWHPSAIQPQKTPVQLTPAPLKRSHKCSKKLFDYS